MAQYFQLWDELQMVHLNSDEDSIRWKPTTDGHFSCSSAYKLFFVAMELCPVSELIWQAKTPARVRFFTWLAVKGRCLPGDNLAKRGWPHDDNCVLCDREPEDCYHLFVSCDYTSEMWRLMRQWTSISFPTPGIEGLQPTDWWIQARLCFRKSYRSNFSLHAHMLADLEITQCKGQKARPTRGGY